MDFESCIDSCRNCADECDKLRKDLSPGRPTDRNPLCRPIAANCAQFCRTTAGFMERGSTLVKEICGMCAQICDACVLECKHEASEHVPNCIGACRDCANECRRVLAQAA
jgi:hypothetical protein